MNNPWNTRFQDESYVYGTEPNVFISDMQKRLRLSGDALAIAEGEGRNAAFLAGESYQSGGPQDVEPLYSGLSHVIQFAGQKPG